MSSISSTVTVVVVVVVVLVLVLVFVLVVSGCLRPFPSTVDLHPSPDSRCSGDYQH